MSNIGARVTEVGTSASREPEDHDTENGGFTSLRVDGGEADVWVDDQVPTLLIDPSTGQIVDGNELACSYYGYTRDLLRSLNIRDINTAPPERIRESMARAVARQQRRFEFEHRLSSGTLRDVEVHSGSIVIHGRSYLLSYVHDVTDQKAAERQLRESEARYRALFDQMVTGFALHEAIRDADGTFRDYRYIDVNRAFERLTGTRREDVIGRTIGEVLPGIEPKWISVYAAVVDTGQPTRFVDYTATLDRYFEVVAYRPAPEQFVTSFTDVTEQVKAERALRESEERLRKTVASTSAGYFRLDGEGRFADVNRAWLDMHGYVDAGEVLGRDIGLTQTPEDLAVALDVVRRLLAGESFPTGEFSRLLRDGSIGYHRFSAHPVIQNGVIAGAEGFLIDVTEQRRAELSDQATRFRLASLAEMGRLRATSLTVTEVCDLMMRSSIEITRSRFGYVYLYDEETRVLTNYAWSRDVVPASATVEKQALCHLDQTGFWGEAIRQRRPVVTNDHAADNSWGNGYPAGHVDPTRHLSLPVFDGERIVALVGVANKTGPYDEGDVRQLQLLAEGAWHIIQSARAEESLRESELKYRIVADNTYDWEFWLTPGGDFAYSSPSCERITGRSPAEFATNPGLMREIVHPDDLHIFDECHNDSRAAGSPTKIEYRIVRTDGEVRWIAHLCRPIYDDRGAFLGTRGGNRDITERKQAESAVREAENRYRTLFEQSPYGIVTYDPETMKPLAFNDAAHSMFGYSREEFAALAVFDYDVAARFERIRAQIARLRSLGGAVFETKTRAKDGEIRDSLVSIRLVELSGRTAILATYQDVTERNQARERMRWDADVQTALVELYRPMAEPDTTMYEIARTVLHQARRLTGCAHGYVSAMDPVTGDNVIHTLTDMLSGQCQVLPEGQRISFARGADGRYPGLWGLSLNTGEAFYTNSPAEHPSARGVPTGHLPIERFLSVSVTLGSSIVGQIALTNPTRDFTERDLDAIKRIAEYYALAIQRQRHEDALRASEARYRDFFEHSPVPTWEEDYSAVREFAEGLRASGVSDLRAYLAAHPEDLGRCADLIRVVEVNPAGLRFFGASDRREFLVTFGLQFESARDLATFADEVVTLVDGATQFEAEKEVRILSGEVRSVIIRISAIFGHERALDRILVSFVDITDSKQREALVRMNESRLTVLAELGQTRDLSVAQLCDYALRKSIEITDSRMGHILTYDEDTRLLTPMAGAGDDSAGPGRMKWPPAIALDESGLLGEAVRQRRPVVIDDYDAPHPGKRELPPEHTRIERMASLPIFVNGRIVATIGIGNKARPYSDEDLQQVTLLMEGVWRLVERSQSDEAVKRYNQRLSLLQELDRRILAAQSAEEIADFAVRQVRAAIPSDEVLLILFDQSAGAARALTHDHVPTWADLLHEIRPLTDFALPDDDSRMLRYCPDITRLNAPDRAMRDAIENGLRSVLTAPLFVAGERLGFVNLASARVDAFSAEQQEMAREVANQVAIGLQQARLREELRQHSAELERRVENRTRQLSEANAELDSFAYSVSHDLRAPLRALQSYSEILLEEHTASLDDDGRNFVRRINGAAKRMDTLVRDVLAFSRATRFDGDLEPVGLSLALKEAQLQVEAVIAESGARVEVEADLPFVRANKTVLVRAIANLLGNAVKFVAEGVTPMVSVRTETRAQVVRLWVEDNGIGIAPENQERIFAAFERLHGIEEYPGTGIGLAVVKKGVERMGGRVGVESALGHGSRFWIELPGA